MIRTDRRLRLVAAGLAAACLAVTLTPAAARAQVLPLDETPAEIGIHEGQWLVRAVRRALTPEDQPSRIDPPTATVTRELGLPIIATLYRGGRPKWQHASAQPTMRASAEAIAKELRSLVQRQPASRDALAQCVVEINIVLRSEPLTQARNYFVDRHLTPGIHGVVFQTEQDVVYLTPTQILRHQHKPDIIGSAYAELENATPPLHFTASRIRTVAYVEALPGGSVYPLFRCNVLPAQPDAEQITRAMTMGALWLLRQQGPDGAFAGTFAPAEETNAPPERDMADHLRAVVALIQVETLVRDEVVTKAVDRAITAAVSAMKEDLQRNFIHIPSKTDAASPSALLLTALSLRALRDRAPTATGRMRYLGNFLCVMTDRNGRVFARVPQPGEPDPPYDQRGETYADVLMALSLLQSIAPDRRYSETADRLAAFVTTDRKIPPFPVMRTVEAAAAWCRVNTTPQRVALVLALADRLTSIQTVKSVYPDCLGGYAQPDLPPDTETTAQALGACAAAFEVAESTGRPGKTYAERAYAAAKFLLTMQYRPENVYFLEAGANAVGAFRRSPEDLRIVLSPNAEAVRALIPAAAITARTRPISPDEPLGKNLSPDIDTDPSAR